MLDIDREILALKDFIDAETGTSPEDCRRATAAKVALDLIAQFLEDTHAIAMELSR